MKTDFGKNLASAKILPAPPDGLFNNQIIAFEGVAELNIKTQNIIRFGCYNYAVKFKPIVSAKKRVR